MFKFDLQRDFLLLASRNGFEYPYDDLSCFINFNSYRNIIQAVLSAHSWQTEIEISTISSCENHLNHM